jgi:AcrR family transcriptional regulator
VPRAGLSTEAVVDGAAALADAEGLQALTLAALAQRLGVRSPSLYAHVTGLSDLRERLATRGARQLAKELRAAATGRSGSQALHALAGAYRAYARLHPGSYAALQYGLTDGDARREEAAAEVVEIVLAVLRGHGLGGERALHAVRVLRSALHGFVSLEEGGGFALDLDANESFELLVATVEQGLRALAGQPQQ